MIDAAWTWNHHSHIPSSTDAGHAIIESLMTALEEAGWEGRELFHVRMSVEEAMVNAVTHGNKKADDKQVEIEFKVAKDVCYLRLKDEGEGFRLEDIPDPRAEDRLECTHGRGVMLIHELMTEVTYNDNCNQVTMIKRRELPDEQ